MSRATREVRRRRYSRS